MKKLFFTIIFGGLFLGPVPFVRAHVLLTDGPVGVVLHIEPDDDPIVGQRSPIFFEFKDKEGRFSPAQCNCRVRLLRDSKEISNQSLVSAEGSGAEMSAVVVFPERALYQLQISGAPRNTGVFQPFTLIKDVRVDRVPSSQDNATKPSPFENPHTLHAVGIFAVFSIVALGELRKRYRQYKRGKVSGQ